MSSDILNKILKNKKPVVDPEFQDDDIPPARSSVKLKSNSLKPKLPSIKNQVNEILQDKDIKKQIALEVTTALYALFDSKILDENKSPQDRQEEISVLSEFKDFIGIINSDPNEEEGMGNLMFTTTLSRILLKQRDRLNVIDHKLNLLLNQQK